MLFKKLKINGITLKNRIVVSPMCQYSAKNGCPSEWHYDHLSKLINCGASMLMMESTSVNKIGKISHKDLCLSNSFQEKKFKKLINFLKNINDIPIGLQISHSGRKGSSFVPWEKSNEPLKKRDKSWQTFSASAIKRDKHWPTPKEFKKNDLLNLVKKFKSTAIRAKRIGFDCLEIHMAHGYLLHQFLSPISNKRNDEYGLNKFSFPLNIVKEIRKVWPKERILGARITATDHLKNGLTLKDSIKLVNSLKKAGLDYVCVSSGGILPKTNMKIKSAFRKNLSKKIKNNSKIFVRTSGNINDIKLAEKLLKKKYVDFIAVGRKLIKDPNWIISEAKKRKIPNYVPNQYLRCI